SPNRLYTDQIYMISLQKHAKYRARVQSIHDHLGLDVRYFKGIDANQNRNELMNDPMANKTAPNVVACWQSHLEVWKDIDRRQYETALVLEDDMDMQGNIHMLMKSAMEIAENQESSFEDYFDDRNRHGQWDVIFIGHCSVSEKRGEVIDKGFQYLRKSSEPACTQGYVMSRAGVKKFLKHYSTSLDRPVDITFAENILAGFIYGYSFFPPVVTQRRDLDRPRQKFDIYFKAPSNSILEFIRRHGRIYTDKDIVKFGMY
ncbi:hypothetical protein H4219_006425, partial [Mycoemilia scoparia]